MTKTQNSKQVQGLGTPLVDRNVSVIGISDLNIIWVLGFEIWDLGF